MVTVFFSYSHKDENLRDQLETHLAMLKRQGVISAWHDRRLIVGTEIDAGISQELERADIILLLVSPDFLASDFCYGVEMSRALKRHAEGTARVIPVILRPCEWAHAPFGELLAAPKDGKPVTRWTDPDEAFLDITRAIRAAAVPITGSAPGSAPVISQAPSHTLTPAAGPRSSNLRLRKSFTEQDRDRFLDEAFEFMARFFENSLQEFQSRNPGIGGGFKRLDAARFTATIYRDGKALTRCQIRLGGHFNNGISFSFNANPEDNSMNDSLSVEVGEQSLYLKPLNDGRRYHLSPEGASEYYWDLFIQRLQE
jgi:hypothetical protein